MLDGIKILLIYGVGVLEFDHLGQLQLGQLMNLIWGGFMLENVRNKLRFTILFWFIGRCQHLWSDLWWSRL